MGQIQLPVSFDHGEYARTEDIIYDMVDVSYQYNAIFEKCCLSAFYAVPHHGFLCMKMSGLSKGTIKVLGDQKLAKLIEIRHAWGSGRSTS